MAKVKLSKYEDINESFANLLKGKQHMRGIKTQSEISKLVGKAYSTTNKLINQPEEMTIEDLRNFIAVLGLKKDEVIAFIYGEKLDD